MYMNVFIKRKESRMTQKDVAAVLGITPKQYSKKEKGEYDFLLRECRVLANLFDTTLDDLFREEFKTA